MATALQANGQPRVIGDIVAIDAADIDASERLRPIDEAWGVALGHIMLTEGQRTPIEVCRSTKGKPWRLVSGGHRHWAAGMFLDLNPLKAIEVEAGELSRRQAEIAENLWRRALDPLDRAVFVAEMHDVLRARAGLAASIVPQEIAANARWKKQLRDAADDACDTMTHAYGFTTAIADQIGLQKRTVERDLMLARRLSQRVVSALRGHKVASNATELRALARLDAGQQEAVAAEILAGAKGVAAALANIAGKIVAATSVRYSPSV